MMSRDHHDLNADDIPWVIPPLPRAEDDHPLVLANLSHAELLAYAYERQDDVRTLRHVLKVALTGLHDVMVERDALRQRRDAARPS